MLEDLLSSSAKLKCIKVLETSRMPLHLRRIVNLTGLAPRSVQLALIALKDKKLLVSKKVKNRELYYINKDSKFYLDVKDLVSKLQAIDIRNRSNEYQNLKDSINFIESATKLIKDIKKDNELN